MTEHARHSDDLLKQALIDNARGGEWETFADNLLSLMVTLGQLRRENAEREATIAALTSACTRAAEFAEYYSHEDALPPMFRRELAAIGRQLRAAIRAAGAGGKAI